MKTQKIPAVEKQTIGLDLGDRRHFACVLDDTGEILAEEAIANPEEVLTAFRPRYLRRKTGHRLKSQARRSALATLPTYGSASFRSVLFGERRNCLSLRFSRA